MTRPDPAPSGRAAVITGASSGIGRALALALAKPGSWIGLVGRRVDALERVAGEVRDLGGQAAVLVADLSCDRDVIGLIETARSLLPGLDVLIHSAGQIVNQQAIEATSAALRSQLKVNTLTPERLSRALLPMLQTRRGQIVFINSSVGLTPEGATHPYGATKHALKTVADAIRAEVNRDGIRVLSVYPGRTATPMQEAVHASEGRAYRAEALLRAEEVAASVVFALDLPETVEITDLAIRPMRPLSSVPPEER